MDGGAALGLDGYGAPMGFRSRGGLMRTRWSTTVTQVASVVLGGDGDDVVGSPELISAAVGFRCRRRARFWAMLDEPKGQGNERKHVKKNGQGVRSKRSQSSPKLQRRRRSALGSGEFGAPVIVGHHGDV